MTLGGWTASDIGELLVKLAPAATIVVGLLAAQVQWKRQQKLNGLLIAKEHYRLMLENMTRHADLLFRGSTLESLGALQQDPIEYRRYILLFAQVSFALQEIFFATDAIREKHWGQVIRTFFKPFQPFMTSADFTNDMEAAVDPRFSAYIRTLATGEERRDRALH